MTNFASFWILFGIGQILRKLGADWWVEWSMYAATAQVLWHAFWKEYKHSVGGAG